MVVVSTDVADNLTAGQINRGYTPPTPQPVANPSSEPWYQGPAVPDQTYTPTPPAIDPFATSAGAQGGLTDNGQAFEGRPTVTQQTAPQFNWSDPFNPSTAPSSGNMFGGLSGAVSSAWDSPYVQAMRGQASGGGVDMNRVGGSQGTAANVVSPSELYSAETTSVLPKSWLDAIGNTPYVGGFAEPVVGGLTSPAGLVLGTAGPLGAGANLAKNALSAVGGQAASDLAGQFTDNPWIKGAAGLVGGVATYGGLSAFPHGGELPEEAANLAKPRTTPKPFTPETPPPEGITLGETKPLSLSQKIDTGVESFSTMPAVEAPFNKGVDMALPRPEGMAPNENPDYMSASQKILDAARNEASLRSSGTAAAEITAGRSEQASGIGARLAEGKTQGLSGQELATFARSGAATGTLRNTLTDGINLTVAEKNAVLDDFGTQLQAGKLSPFDYLKAQTILAKLTMPDINLQPAEIDFVRAQFGDEVANAAAAASGKTKSFADKLATSTATGQQTSIKNAMGVKPEVLQSAYTQIQRAKAVLGETSTASALNRTGSDLLDSWAAGNRDILPAIKDDASYVNELLNRQVTLKAALENAGVESGRASRAAKFMNQSEMLLKYPDGIPAPVQQTMDLVQQLASHGQSGEAAGLIDQAFSAMRELTTVGHLGVPGLQNWPLMMTHTGQWMQDAVIPLYKALANPETVQLSRVARVLEATNISPEFAQMTVNSPLKVFGGITGDISSNFMHKIPGFGNLLDRNAASYNASTEGGRWNWFTNMSKTEMAAKGRALTQDEVNSIANKANHLSSTISAGTTTNRFLGALLWTPKMLASQAALLRDMASTGAGAGAVRKAVGQSLGEAIAATLAANYTFSGAGLSDPTNTKNRDLWGPGLGMGVPDAKMLADPMFGRINVGGQKISLIGPFTSQIRTVMSLALDAYNRDPGAAGQDFKFWIGNHLAPLTGVFMSAYTGKNSLGQPATIQSMLTQFEPISVQTGIKGGEAVAAGNPIGAAAQAASLLTNVKMSDISPSQNRNLDINGQTFTNPNTGTKYTATDYFSSPSWVRKMYDDQSGGKLVSTNPATVERTAKVDQVKTDMASNQSADDATFTAGAAKGDPTAGQTWRDAYHANQYAMGFALDQLYNPPGGTPYVPTNPEDLAMKSYSDFITANDANGKISGVDWNAVDSYVAQHPEVQQALANRIPGAPASPVIQEYNDTKKTLDASGFFARKDDVWKQIAANSPELSGFKTLYDYEQSVDDQVRPQLSGMAPIQQDQFIAKILSKNPLVGIATKLDKQVTLQWAAANPQDAAAAFKFGYLRPTRLESLIIAGATQ